MRLGFGCTLLARGLQGDGVDGIGSYTRELGARLRANGSVDLRPVSFGVPLGENSPWPDDAETVLARFAPTAALCAVSPARFPLRGAAPIDLFHATDHLIPRLANTPVVATLMDAVPLAHPEWIRMRFARFKIALWRRTVRWADHVLTISNYSKTELCRHFGIPADKISVIPLGVDERYFERFDSLRKAEVLKRLGLPERFFLFVGTLQPRKNIERVLDAHAALPLSRQKDVPMVIVGRNGWGEQDLVARLNNQAGQGRVYWLQYLPDEDVRVLMQSARALVFVSLYEGFGLPVVEAFASGLPVIASNTTALPEVAQDAALMVNPLDAGEICDAMRQIDEHSGLVRDLVAAGERRARTLSWSACAQKTLDVYRSVLHG